MIDRLSQLLNSRWLINQEVVSNYIPLFFAFLNGYKLSDTLPAKDQPYVLPCRAGEINIVESYDLASTDIPENSVAVFPLSGEILSWKSMKLVSQLQEADQNPNIISHLLLVNTPGGMVFYTDLAAASIKNLQKPSVAFVMNMAASAGMWMISGTSRIIASSPLDRIGSIGTMATIMDYSNMLKQKLGIDLFEIYADKSTEKNQHIRTLLNTALTMEERTAPIREDLNFVNEVFHQTISDNLFISRDSEVFSGKIYNAQHAIDLGLCHEINTFSYAVNYAYQLGLVNTINHFIHSNP